MSPSTLAIIPSRGGSKGIPKKNIAPLLGKPLIAYTLEAALGCKAISRTIVSSDDTVIMEVARAHGAETPFVRPAACAGDEVHASAVVFHALDWLREHENYEPSRVLMLLPTAPMRHSRHLDEAIQLFERTGAPAVISVYRSDKQLPHFRKVVNGVLEPLVPMDSFNVQRQDLDPLFLLNGSIYVSTPAILREHKTFHVPGAVAYEMSARDSVDINCLEDLALAEFYLQQRLEKTSCL